MDDFSPVPAKLSRGAMRGYAGASLADADVVVFCYSSEVGADPSKTERLAREFLTAAEQQGMAEGLCVIPLVSSADPSGIRSNIQTAVHVLESYNQTAARVLSCVDSPSHADEVASGKAIYSTFHIDRTVAALPGRSQRLVDGIRDAKLARRDRLNRESGRQIGRDFDFLYETYDSSRHAVAREYERFLGSGDPTVLTGHLIDLPADTRGIGVGLSNRTGADLRLSPEIVCILDRNLAARPNRVLAASEARVVWAADPELDVGEASELLNRSAGRFVAGLGRSPAKLRLRVESPQGLDVINHVFGEPSDPDRSGSRTHFGDRIDDFGNRGQVIVEICGDSPLDPEVVAMEYGLPVVDRRGTSILTAAAEDAPDVSHQTHQPSSAIGKPVGYVRRHGGRSR